MINCLRDIVNGERGVAVFTTKGDYLRIVNGGISESGIWKLNPLNLINIQTVIIYYRHDKSNEIIIGNYTGIKYSHLPGQYYLLFNDALTIGYTENNWLKFAETHTSPVRYFPLYSDPLALVSCADHHQSLKTVAN